MIGIFHPDIEKAREEFIDRLIRYKTLTPHDVTVVFDGYKSGAGTEQAAVRGGVRVIYSRLGERADEVIKRVISADRREWIVVSSDREIVNHAWSVNSVPVPSETFVEILSKKIARGDGFAETTHPDEKNVEGYGRSEDAEIDTTGAYRKGNPFRLSKKEKARRRALDKL